MASEAYLEIIDREGQVRRRHEIAQWPCRIGRGYDQDIILDDPHVAAAHAVLELSVQGEPSIRDLGTCNGVLRGSPGHRFRRCECAACGVIDGEAVFRLGKTTIRIRRKDFQVAPELPLERTPLLRRPATAAMLYVVLSAMAMLQAWLAEWDEAAGKIFSATLGATVLLMVWLGIWSAVSRLAGGAALFFQHAIVACAFAIVWILGAGAIDLLHFSFGLEEQSWALYAPAATLALSGLFYAHLRLVMRLPPPRLLMLASSIGLLSVGVAVVQDRLKKDPGHTDFQSAIFHSSLLLTQGQSRQEFIAQAKRRLFQPDR